MRATLGTMAQVENATETRSDIEDLARPASLVATAIRDRGLSTLDELVEELQLSKDEIVSILAELEEKQILESETVEEIDLIAARRVRRGETTGGSSIEEFATEFGVDPAPPK